MKGRYIYCPMTARRIGRRMTILDRLRRSLVKREKPDVFPVVDYWPPIYPAKN